MSDRLLQRRQLLLYLGLGIGGAGAAIALSRQDQPKSPESMVTVANPDTSIVATPSPSRAMPLPEFQGITQWLNSAPLTVADLKGNVVLVQIWTFSCINCQRTLPSVTRWHQQYAARGLKVIGVHTPEFPFERDVNNIKAALEKHQITYPIAVDNEFKTWKAYNNEYWPHLFLADRQGILRYDHIGEGAYDRTEQTIRQLLG